MSVYLFSLISNYNSNDKKDESHKFSSSTHKHEEWAFAQLIRLDIIKGISNLKVNKCADHEWNVENEENIEE